jgi:dihydropteroate synthase
MSLKDTLFSVNQTINCKGRTIDLTLPRIMGILNVTPDSFYDGGYFNNENSALERVEKMLSEGADIIDIGGYSSRPGALEISEEEEWLRLHPFLKQISKNFTDAVISVDTYRSGIAKRAILEYGAGMVNDISSGSLDNKMLDTVGQLKVPYVMMHMQGTPDTMQNSPHYTDIVRELLAYFSERISAAKNSGIHDIILDPGFGFGKTLNDNYTLLRDLRLFGMLGYPVIAGLSRKSMIHKPLDILPPEALNGTTVLNTLALYNGAKLLRVHDVKEAVQAVKLMRLYQGKGK